MEYVKEFKATDSGANGKKFELMLKEFFNMKNVTVSKQGRIDLIKYVDGQRKRFELKTASGELATLDKDGNVKDCITKNDFIIYQATATSNVYVMDAKAFWDMVNNNDLVRDKASTYQSKQKKDGKAWFKDKLTLKTIDDKTSHKQRDKINALLDNNAVTLDEFVASHKITTK